MVEKVYNDSKLLAIIIRKDHRAEGVEFLTPNDYSQQLAYMEHPKGKEIQPHIHNPVPRQVQYTQ